MVTKRFLHNCLSSWQDKIISCAVSSTVAQRAIWKKSVTRVTEGEAWDHKVCPETEIVKLFLGEEGKDIWLVPEWFCSPSCLKLSCLYLKTVSWLTAQPHSVYWLGLSILWHSLRGCSHTVLPPSFTITDGTQDVEFKRKDEVKIKALH